MSDHGIPVHLESIPPPTAQQQDEKGNVEIETAALTTVKPPAHTHTHTHILCMHTHTHTHKHKPTNVSIWTNHSYNALICAIFPATYFYLSHIDNSMTTTFSHTESCLDDHLSCRVCGCSKWIWSEETVWHYWEYRYQSLSWLWE